MMRLRPLCRPDADALAGWLPAVAAEAGLGDRSAEAIAALSRCQQTRGVDVDGELAGLIAWTLHGRDGRFQALALKPASRRRGRGILAVVLAEEEMIAAGVTRAWAPAPAAHGIALYFWLRLGYSPLPRTAWPRCRSAEPVAWLARDLGPPNAKEGARHEHERDRSVRGPTPRRLTG